jgi:hypothetical protein
MKLVLTGSRAWDDAKTIRGALDAVARGLVEARDPELVVRHGACPNGADAIADMWVRSWMDSALHVTADRHPALWRKFGKRAGIVRNEQMIALGCSLVLAFIRDDSPGATHCAELASDAGIPLRVWRYGEPGVTSMDSRHLADEDVLP